jgi:hypothetical protein
MTQFKRRPGVQPAFDSVNQDPKRVQKFNENLRYVQGVRTQLAASSTSSVNTNLNSPGKFLLGLSIIPVSGTNSDITDCQVTLTVNNNNILLDCGAFNLIPTGDMIYFPTPQPLTGKDTIKISVLKNNASAVNVIINYFYIPQ